MPVELDITRTVSDEGLSSTGTAPAVGGGGGASTSAIDGLETTIIGIPPPETTLIRHAPTVSVSITGVVMDAETAPSTDFSLTLERINAETRSVEKSQTVTLPGGSNRVFSQEVALEITEEDLLVVSTASGDQYTDTLSTLTVNLVVS